MSCIKALWEHIRPLSIKEQLLSLPCPRCGVTQWDEQPMGVRYCGCCGFVRSFIPTISIKTEKINEQEK